MADYDADFPVGSLVRVAARHELEEFMRTWKYHHELRPEQLAFADQVREVKDVGYYHGGAPLYELEGIPYFLWHESCLRLAD